MQQDQKIPLTGGKIFIMILVFFCLGILPGIIVDFILYQAWTKPRTVVIQNFNGTNTNQNTDNDEKDSTDNSQKIEG